MSQVKPEPTTAVTSEDTMHVSCRPRPVSYQSNEHLEQLCDESRARLLRSSLQHQSSLAALLDKIELVKSGQEKLERDNHALQEYIGGLTRSMSSSTTGSGLTRSTSIAGTSRNQQTTESIASTKRK